MKNQFSKKNLYITAGVIAAAVLGYYAFFSTPSADNSALLQQESGDIVIGTQVLSLLNQIQSLHIDTALFQSAAFRSLQDYSVAIPPQTVGRPNPFAPLPGINLAPGGVIKK